MKRLVALLSVMILLLGYSATAYAAPVSVTIQRGDTICGICNRMGLSYNACKASIMKLNNMSSEKELDRIKVGSEILMPSENPEINCGNDEIEYYVIRYILEEGNWLANVYYCWGLNYEDYIEDIKALNGLKNLDNIYINASLLLPTTAENVKTDDYVKVMCHIIQSGDTAYSVVSSYGLDYNSMQDMLVKYNPSKNLEKLKVGEKLLIPFYE